MPAPTKDKIVEKFNESIISIENALKSAISGDLNSTFKYVENSATEIYQSIEWAIKYHLLSIFPNESRFQSEHNKIEGTRFIPKLDLFENRASPLPGTLGIDVGIIRDLKRIVRNDPEHSGLVPHFNSLKKVIVETEKILKNYISSNIVLKVLPENSDLRIIEDSNWIEFISACNNFERERNYILISGPIQGLNTDLLKPLGLIDWNIVFDFDPSSDINGLLNKTKNQIEQKRVVHQVILGDRVSRLASFNSTYWIHTNGSKSRLGTEFSSFREWNRNYSAFLDNLIEIYQKTLSSKPTTVVIVWDSLNEVSEIIKLLDKHFANSLQFVYSISDCQKMAGVIESYDGFTIDIEINQIAQGVLKIRSYFDSVVESDLILVPSKDNDNVILANEDFLWIEEDFELLHLNILNNSKFLNEIDSRESFYKGNIITWKGLQLRFDIEREIESSIVKSITELLKQRLVGVSYTIYHYPGIGGTTISRRAIWDIHNQYPVLILRSYRVNESIDRIYKLFQVSSLPPIILIESSLLPHDEILRLQNEISSRTFPALLVLVQRKNEYVPKKINEIFISEMLTDLELNSFVNNYSELVPTKRELLMKSLKSSEPKEKHPFYLGLLAFEENFVGLSEFVRKSLRESTEIQKKIIGYIAICYYYSQAQVPSQFFTGLLGVSESNIVRLEKHLNQGLLHLIINESELNWRPIHQLVSREIIRYILGGNDGISEEILKYRLVDWSLDFIKMLGDKSYDATDDELFLLKKLFIYRDSENSIEGEEESEFSNLIEEGLPTDEARLQIFKQLTESFSHEAHFWAHLARFYNFKMKQSDKALEAIEEAIRIVNHEDYSLHHVKGMCLRSKVYRIMNKNRGNKNSGKDSLPEIISLLENSSEQFEICRNINEYNEYGYVSQIQLIITYLDFKFTISGYDSKKEFIRRLNTYDLEMLNLAEELLETIKRIHRDRPENYYISKCNAGLHELYSDFSSIIESWNNLLDPKKDTPKELIRRQLVRAYVRRAGDWINLKGQEVSRIIAMLEDNISLDPKNKQNLYLWFQAAKQTNSIELEDAINRLANWRSLQDSIDAAYYLGLLHTIQAINGFSVSKIRADELIRETSERSRSLGNRAYCFEWYAKGENLKKIVSANNAVTREQNGDFIFNSHMLDKIKGKVVEIKGPEAGKLELECGLKVFFIPARADNNRGVFRDKDVNKDVDFYLGFSYDGLRAFDVKRLS